MINKIYILVFLILTAALSANPSADLSTTQSTTLTKVAEPGQNREWQIKAAFVYNFINFVDWPKEKMKESDTDEPITIGIIGNENFTKSFDPVKDKKIRGKNIVIKYYKDLKGLDKSQGKENAKQKQAIESLKKCHIVFLCNCNSTSIENSAAIIKALKGSSVLTVGEQAGFLENGGNIKFVTEKKKIRFEINLDSVKNNGLKIRSKLLKLAKRVIKEEKTISIKN